jgi:general secretion pathway protein G
MTAKNQISTFKSALEQYKLFMGSYPSTLDALHEAPSDLSDPSKYTSLLKDPIPRDPWDTPYKYEVSGESYDLRSLGADRQDGTSDDITAAPAK